MPEINISNELHEHYQEVKRTRDAIIDDPDTTGSEKSAILNATTAILKDLTKLLDQAYSADSIAEIQQAIFSALEAVDPELKLRVVQELEDRLGRIN